MSKPWSEAGIAAEWTEWRALFRNYAIGAILVALALWGAGFQCARVHYTRPDPATGQEQQRAQVLRNALAAEKHRGDSIGVALLVAQAALARDAVTAAALHREAERRDQGIVIDTAVAAVVTLLPAEDSGSSVRAIAPDTVAYVDLQRPNDERHYSVPKFFAASYLAQRADRQGLLVENRDLHEIVDVMTSKAALLDSADAVRDSINASLARQVAALTARRAPWCQFKCGAVTTLVTLIAGAIAMSAVHR